MKKRLLLSLLAALLLPSAAEARPVSADEAAAAATRWLSRSPRPLGAKMAAAAASEVRSVAGDDGEPLFHVVRIEGGGVVVASAETGVEPIVAFLDADDIEESPDNPLYAILLADMASRRSQVRAVRSRKEADAGGAGTPFAAEEEAWAGLLGEEPAEKAAGSAKGISSVSDVRVAPLIETRWGQSDGAANYYTPNRYVCGCVALAGAQIARFWRFPTSSRPAVTRTCYVSGSSRSFTSLGGTYSWSQMPATFSSLSDSQCEAIGRLCYDFGVATYMNWSSGGSGTGGYCLDDAFTTVFGYANSRTYVGTAGGAFSSDVVAKTILANLDAKCPVSLGIDGHMVDADGYGYSSGTLYTHINMGWRGSGDAWYALPYVSTSGYSSTVLDTAVYNIFPLKTGDLLTGRVLDRNGRPVAGATVRASGGPSSPSTTTDANGIYALWVEGGYTWTATATSGSLSGSVSVRVTASVSTRVSGKSYYPGTGTPGNSWGNDITLSGTVSTAPSAPTGVSASQGDYGDRVRVSWNASSGATTYTVYRASSATGTQTSVGTTTSTSWDDTTASAGTTYWYWVKASNAVGTSPFSASASGYRAASPTRPANDDFANAWILSGTSGSASGSNVNATTQTGEPTPSAQSSSGSSVWWSWTAPGDGTAVFDTDGSDFDTVLAVYTGSSVTSLSEVVSNDDGGSGGDTSRCEFSVTSGTTYRISVRGYSSNTGSIALNWSFSAAGGGGGIPEGLDAESLSWTTSSTYPWQYVTDVSSDGEDSVQSGGILGYDTTWVQTTVTGPATVSFKYRKNFYTARFFATVDGSEVYADSENAHADTTWRTVSFSVGSGSHAVRLSYTHNGTGWSYEHNGVWVDRFSVSSSGVVRPANDDFANAGALSGSSGSTSGTSVNATRQTGEPEHCGRTTGSVWWRWTAPGNGTAVFDTDGSDFDTVMAVYTGSSVSSLSEIASDDDGGSDGCSRCEFAVTSGTTYRIAVAGWSGEGSVALNWRWTSSSSPPAAPSWIEASEGWYDDYVYVDWGSSAGATSYTVYRATSSSGSKTSLGTTESTWWYDYDAEPGTTYWYWVKASNGAGTSGFSGSAYGWRAESEEISVPEALDNWTLSFTTGGDAEWFGQDAETSDGEDAAQSGPISDGESTWLEASVEGPGTISFWWNVSSESVSWDWLEFLVDDEQRGKIGGTDSSWRSVSFEVAGSGSHTLRWNYRKDGSVSSGSDCGWVDRVVWTPSAVPSAPSRVSASDGTYATHVRVEWASSTGATSYEVFRATGASETKVSLGTTSSTSWNDTSATAGTTYWYWVKASNSAGTSGFGSYDTGWRSSGGSSSGGKYALCVGINEYSYEYGVSDLSGCVNDAKYFRKNLVGLGGWQTDDTTLLTDEGATKSAIRAALADYASRAVAGDSFVYLHSSHGGNDWASPLSAHLCTYDGDYSDEELATDLARFRSGVKIVVIVDACHSGGLFKDGRGKEPAFDLADRVTAILDGVRAKERKSDAKGAAAKISSSEIGWVTAAEYDESSIDFGYYDTDDWLTDPYAWGGSACSGTFLGSFTWSWWNGSADAGAAGDGDGLFDAYEGWNEAYDFCTSLDGFWGEPGYSFTPQFRNESVLRSVELGGCGFPPGPGRPGNDDFSAAYVLSGDSGSTEGTNEGATTESGEWADDYDAEGSVWWRWTAPTTGIVRFSTEGSDFDTILTVYTGSSFGSMQAVATDDDRGEGLTSVVSFRATAGTTYRIAVYGYESDRGDIRLSWQNGFAAVHRFYSRNYRGHFFTINEGEMRNLRRTNRNWTYEGVTYLAYPTRLAGMVPVYRFYSSRYRAHFFTINEGEMWNLRRTNRNWRYEGIAYYVYPDSSRGGSPVYRFWSRNYRHHFFTTNEDERDDLRYGNRNWSYEGVAYYAMSAGYYSDVGSSQYLAGPEAGAAAESAESEAAAEPADAAENAGGPDLAAKTAEASAGAAADGIGARGSCGATSAPAAPAVRPVAWTLAAADGTAVAADGATKVGGALVEACSDAPEAAELAAPDPADPEAEAVSLRLELPAGAWTATLWSASGGAVADEAAEGGAFAFELPADGAWRWLRVLDAAGREAYGRWLRAE